MHEIKVSRGQYLTAVQCALNALEAANTATAKEITKLQCIKRRLVAESRECGFVDYDMAAVFLSLITPLAELELHSDWLCVPKDSNQLRVHLPSAFEWLCAEGHDFHHILDLKEALQAHDACKSTCEYFYFEDAVRRAWVFDLLKVQDSIGG